MWPEAVERVAAFARAAGIEARLEELSAKGSTPAERADAIGCRLGQLVTTRVFVGSPDRLIVALVPGEFDPVLDVVSRCAAVADIHLAEDTESVRATGFALAAMPPFPLPAAVTLVERRVLAEPFVWVCAGSSEHVLVLSTADLLRVARARVVDLAHESA